jgi:GH24 family phage-related lysozyme (muramidase)
MKTSVREAFPTFTDTFEGKLAFMYLDVKGLVTTGRGNLIDPVPAAHAIPWKHGVNGPFATGDQITAEWIKVKSLQSMRTRGGVAYGAVTELRMSEEDIDALTFGKLDEMYAYLGRRFRDLDEWPADAQLGLLSMAWAMGPGFHFPNFEAAARNTAWTVCADECKMNADGNPGLIPRNAANKKLFLNAASSTDPDVLYGFGSP